MKNYILILLISFTSCLSFGQAVDYNLDNGYIAEGYDVVEYFNNKAVKGNRNYVLSYMGAKYKFTSEENKAKFKANPSKFAPQYGGWCSYAIGKTGEKVGIDPETFEIRDGKLYLFYNSWGNNTKKSWLEEGPVKLRSVADTNWEKIKNK